MRTLNRPLLAPAALAVALSLAACGSGPHTTSSASGPVTHPASAPAARPVAALAALTQQQLQAATLTSLDLHGLAMSVRTPAAHTAMISAEVPGPLPGGPCAPNAAVWQAGAPLFTSSAGTDVEVTRSGDVAVTSVHLGAYSEQGARAFTGAVAQALKTCSEYRMQNGSLVLRQRIRPQQLHLGDDSLAWQQESVAADGAALWMSVAVVRVGSTVITAVLDRSSATPVPLSYPAVLGAQITKLRSATR
jgi:hypothetical protein